VANRRISDLQELAPIDVAEEDLFNVVHVAEVDPSLKNKKLTASGLGVYLQTKFVTTTGDTISGNLIVQGNLTVTGNTSVTTITGTGQASFSGLIIQNGLTASGTISGLTLTGTQLQGQTVNAGTGTFTVVSGITANFVSGNFSTRISGATITGNTIQGVSGTFVNLSGTTTQAATGTFGSVTANQGAFSGNVTFSSGINVTGNSTFGSNVNITGTLSGTTVTGNLIQAVTVQAVTGIFSQYINSYETSGTVQGLLFENNQNIAVTITLHSGYNSLSAGPVSVESGYTVTVPSGSYWRIV